MAGTSVSVNYRLRTGGLPRQRLRVPIFRISPRVENIDHAEMEPLPCNIPITNVSGSGLILESHS
jgi:hypothetical protein